MKTKIFVCGNSEIEYLNASKSITPIPVILAFSSEEEYNDGNDLTAEAFYNRLRYDENAKVVIKYQNFVAFCSYIEEAKNDGYEQILFILGNKNYGDIFIPTMLVKSQYNSMPIYIYSSNSLAYPLANMAIEANLMFEAGKTMEDVFSRLDELNKEYTLYFYAPKRDAKYVYSKNFLIAPKIILPPKKSVYRFNGEFSEISSRGTKHVLFIALEEILKNIEGKKFFLLYSDKNSILYSICKNYVLKKLPAGYALEEYPIPPALGVKFGPFTIGAGLINDNKKEDVL